MHNPVNHPGWKHNPVSFDSVFNHSSTTFSFGSPDILPIFGAPPADGKQEDDPLDEGRRVLMWMYTAEDEDFTSVFFLHLLGLDTTGHGYGPHSKVVDGIVKQVEAEIHDFYKDDLTAFLFTADHGMSNIGNHGDGHPDNTRTPWIAWGSGIRTPLPESPSSPSHDKVSAPWGFSNLQRRDVDQVDLTALMAALSGTQWPGNSVGIIPTDVLRAREGEAARLALGNAMGILEQFRIKEELKSRHRLMFRPFPDLSILSDKASINASNHVSDITRQIENRNYDAAEQESKDLARLALRGIDYYDTFDQTRLKWIVTAGYVSFALYTLVYIVEKYGNNKDRRSGIVIAPSRTFDMVILVISGSVTALFALERTPWYCLYASFPLFYVRCLLQYAQHRYFTTRQQVEGHGFYSVVMSLSQCVLAVGVLFYIATGYNVRSVWTFGFGLLAAYPFLAGIQITTRDALLWVAVLLPCSFWATMSVEKEENALLLVLLLGLVQNAVDTIPAYMASADTSDHVVYGLARHACDHVVAEEGGAKCAPSGRGMGTARAITASDTYRGLIFLYLVHAGFFCTGNVASIS
ncbi:hypothetical protein QFC22_005671 [Naganishia vaughanmartiniae]|uniref:Uncharacterized protein n=1 Tax=Naganishia vaughanmartiniae TaxID=1424756 RepID=A0ACC2WR32_9TREE|nr:hypothetical protein QFC22_005671 [Naganishia vaughanmartiniae]